MLTRLASAVVLVATLAGCVTVAPSATPTSAPTATQAPTSNPTPTPTPNKPAATPTPQGTTPATPSASSPQATATTPPTSTAPSSAPPSASPSGSSGRPTFATVDDAYKQSLTWHNCAVQGLQAQCTTVYVPTDYDNPSAGTTALAVARFPSIGVSKGDLFINPGGPGAAGIGFAGYIAQVAPELASNFDILGFDPRGTGQSDPITCLDTADLDTLNAFDPTPEDAQERQQGIDLVTQQGEACEKNTGLLADHVSTIEAARDIDVMRGVLGDDKTNYFGFSYGTFLGTTYAALFPDKVGRMVLDGALIPNTNSFTASEMQTKGLQTEFDAYIAQCVKGPAPCPLGTDATAAANRLRQLLVDIDANPLDTGDSARPLTQALAFYGIVDTMYSPNSWPSLTSALDAALRGDGFPLLGLSDDYFQRQGNGYANNEIQANADINCLDEQIAGGPTPIPESTFVADSPIAGDIMFGFADRGCGDWPLKTSLKAPDYSAPGAPSILVVGTTRDPATPYVWAQQLAHLLQHGELLTRDGDGHTAYISGNQCIVQNVDAFFVDGTNPPPGTTC